MIEIENIGKEANIVTRRIPEDTTASCEKAGPDSLKANIPRVNEDKTENVVSSNDSQEKGLALFRKNANKVLFGVQASK